jgi:diacylglycerol kinase family enzyme
VETEPALLSQADGELLGMTPIEITVAPRAVRLLVPTQPRAAATAPREQGA